MEELLKIEKKQVNELSISIKTLSGRIATSVASFEAFMFSLIELSSWGLIGFQLIGGEKLISASLLIYSFDNRDLFTVKDTSV
jgi:hypothetical protein